MTIYKHLKNVRFYTNSIIQKLGAQLFPGMNEKFGAITCQLRNGMSTLYQVLRSAFFISYFSFL